MLVSAGPGQVHLHDRYNLLAGWSQALGQGEQAGCQQHIHLLDLLLLLLQILCH
jgi:hypothetical protein